MRLHRRGEKRESLAAVKSHLDLDELPALYLRERLAQNLTQQQSRRVRIRCRPIVHEYHPYARVMRRHAPQEVRSRLAGEVAIVEPRSVMRENNFGTELSFEVGTCGVLPSAYRSEEFIRHSGLRNVKQDRIAGLSVIENEVSRSAAAVAFIVEVVRVDEENALSCECQCSREHG